MRSLSFCMGIPVGKAYPFEVPKSNVLGDSRETPILKVREWLHGSGIVIGDAATLWNAAIRWPITLVFTSTFSSLGWRTFFRPPHGLMGPSLTLTLTLTLTR